MHFLINLFIKHRLQEVFLPLDMFLKFRIFIFNNNILHARFNGLKIGFNFISLCFSQFIHALMSLIRGKIHKLRAFLAFKDRCASLEQMQVIVSSLLFFATLLTFLLSLHDRIFAQIRGLSIHKLH